MPLPACQLTVSMYVCTLLYGLVHTGKHKHTPVRGPRLPIPAWGCTGVQCILLQVASDTYRHMPTVPNGTSTPDYKPTYCTFLTAAFGWCCSQGCIGSAFSDQAQFIYYLCLEALLMSYKKCSAYLIGLISNLKKQAIWLVYLYIFLIALLIWQIS